ncbi:U32 family peptidase [Anaerosporobacter sp.]|uniref:U32 family peptidase n=1 Tax=Anaerosporobacter sp. TaxID=1872529 RepID=UPI00286F30CF|nr:U32 family peptidase [Anaerosporobacter sp.]
MRKIEILAPAGSYESLKAAVTASCDAVYIGGDLFGARAYANNLNEDTMMEAIDYAHIHDKALYLTVNTLLKEEELKSKLYSYIAKYYEHGLDAAIVQDLGVMHFLHRNFPELELHASTQMTLTMAEGANILKEYGVTRLVTSRELSLQEIKNIRENTDLEIESFVHGALCYCYSGQCLMSSIIGGRSGNRGRCAQPCRMPYDLYYEKKKLTSGKDSYLLSPKDMCTLSIIPELVDAGIDSFKIEGRMKRPEYTALASHLYRKYVDLYQKLGRKEYISYMEKHSDEFVRDEKDLMDLYNRGNFTKGYYVSHNGKDMMSLTRPNHNGVLVGEVVNVKGNNAGILLSEDVHAQDLLEIRKSLTNLKAKDSYEYTLKDSAKKGTTIRTNFFAKTPVFVGQEVYRIKNQELLDAIRKEYIDTERREAIEGTFLAKHGQPMQLTFQYSDRNGMHSITVYGDEPMEAQKQSATSEQITKQLNKMNTTAFYLKELAIELDEQLFIPNGLLNELRREAVEALTEKILASYKRATPEIMETVTKTYEKSYKSDKAMRICVHPEDVKLLDTVLAFPEIEAIYLNADDVSKNTMIATAKKVKEQGIQFYMVLPAIFRRDIREQFESYVTEELLEALDGIVIKNLEEYAFLKEKNIVGDEKNRELEIIIDSNLYTLNEESKVFWREQGISRFTSSLELNYKELLELDLTDSDMVVYGHTTLMVSAQCLRNSTIGCIKHKGKNDLKENDNPYYEMKDGKQKNFYVRKHCRYCYNTIYNGSALYLLNQWDEIRKLKPRRVRLDFTIENADEVKAILSNCIALSERHATTKQINVVDKAYTKGHYNRGIE